MKQIIAPLAVTAVFAMSACTTPESVENAGLTQWEVDFTDDGKPKRIRITDGKEKSDVTFSADLTTGRAEYSAKDVKAFDGQAFAAEVAKVQANEQGQTLREVAPGAIDAIVDLAKSFAAP